MREIDIALDCFPHNSGTTLLEHLYMGNPFVTYCNRASVGKIGASFLNTLGHKDWIAKSEKEYSDKVVLLASNQKILNKKYSKLKILGTGDIKKNIEISAHFASQQALSKIEKAGGKLSLIKK